MTRIRVLKRSGAREPFQASKIARTLRSAGAGAELARMVARSVANDLAEDLEHFSDQLVPTSLIKNKVVRHTHLAAPHIARKYSGYRKRVR